MTDAALILRSTDRGNSGPKTFGILERQFPN